MIRTHWAAEPLGRHMFNRTATDYDATTAMREEAWADPNVRAFWVGEASAVLGFLERQGVV